MIMNENEISNRIINQAITVQQSPGPGLQESSYKGCLFYKLIRSWSYGE